MFFAIGCIFCRVEKWDDMQIDLHVSLHVDFTMQYVGILQDVLEFNVAVSLELSDACVRLPRLIAPSLGKRH